jgi:hypothetical protein
MLGFKKKLLVKLNRESIDFITENDSFVFKFTLDSVSHSEILDYTLLEKSLGAFLTQNKLRTYKCVLILSEELLYYSSFDLDSSDLDVKIESFLDDIPFNREQIYYKVYYNSKKAIVVASNKSFYGSFLKIFHTFGISFLSVIPILFLENSSNINSVFEKSYLKTHKFDSLPSKNKKKYLIFGLIILFVLFMLGYFYIEIYTA